MLLSARSDKDTGTDGFFNGILHLSFSGIFIFKHGFDDWLFLPKQKKLVLVKLFF